MTEIKKCPFCGIKLDKFGKMFKRDRKTMTKGYQHSHTGMCALDMLIFREEDWQKRIPCPTCAGLKKRIAELEEFAIWMTGCGYDFTQHDYFCKQRDKLLKGR